MSTGDDLERILEWTGWQRELLLPPLVAPARPEQTFAWGRLRVLAAQTERHLTGVSVVTAPSIGGHAWWRIAEGAAVPCSECLLWIALAVAPSYRRQGIGRLLMTSTLQLAITTGYPFVVAVCPGVVEQESLLERAGFRQATISPAGTLPPSYVAYLRPTIHDPSGEPIAAGRLAPGHGWS